MVLFLLQNKQGRSAVDLSSGIKITPVYVNASPRPETPVHSGSGDRNADVVADTLDSDSNDADTDVDLSVVGTSLQNQQQEEPHSN